MGFFKKRQTIEERIQAITDRINDLEKRKATKAKDLDEKKLEVAARLGDLALVENSENEDAVKRSKKSLSIMQENFDDLVQQIQFLEKERDKLQRERLEALVREAPGKAVEAAAAFNALLDNAIDITDTFRKIHQGLIESGSLFHAILKERTAALNALGKIEPLELPPEAGFGKLANAPLPYRRVFEVPDIAHPEMLLGRIVQYTLAVENYGKQIAANPNLGKEQVATVVAGIGELPPPGQTMGNLR